MMKPMTEKMLIVDPVARRPTSTPLMESGRLVMIATGCTKEPNCEARMR